MHFWIDKPAGRNYGFGGRRYACGSSALKARSGQRGRRGREIGPMVTPVHRFQSLNGPSASVHNCTIGSSLTTPRPHHPQQQQHQQQQQQQQLELHRLQLQQHPPVPEFIPHVDEETRNSNDCRIPVIRTGRSDIVISNNVTNAAAAAAAAAGGGGGVNINNERPSLSNETTNGGLNRSGFLDFSEISDTELAGYRLRCGVWITFVLATGFVSVAKFYFGNRDAGLDMLIFCGLLFTLLLSGCFYSTLFRRAQNNHRHQEHLALCMSGTARIPAFQGTEHLDQEDQVTTLTPSALAIRGDENSMRHLNLLLHQQAMNLHQMEQQQQQSLSQPSPPPPPPPPPPYHIAILIPPVNSPEQEAPPPSYDKAMNEDPANQTRLFILTKDDDN